MRDYHAPLLDGLKRIIAAGLTLAFIVICAAGVIWVCGIGG